MNLTISGPEEADVTACERILRDLPDYFGIDEAIVQYLQDIRTRQTFHAYSDGRIAGFLSITRHTAVSAEIHVMGVSPTDHRKGVGRALVEATESYLHREGVKLFEVKTLGESHPDPNYAKTRRFYASAGFLPMEEVPDFWGKGLPTLFLVKALSEKS